MSKEYPPAAEAGPLHAVRVRWRPSAMCSHQQWLHRHQLRSGVVAQPPPSAPAEQEEMRSLQRRLCHRTVTTTLQSALAVRSAGAAYSRPGAHRKMLPYPPYLGCPTGQYLRQSARRRTRSREIAHCTFSLASSKGVEPSSNSRLSKGATAKRPLSRSMRTTSAWPCQLAECRGVRPWSLVATWSIAARPSRSALATWRAVKGRMGEGKEGRGRVLWVGCFG